MVHAVGWECSPQLGHAPQAVSQNVHHPRPPGSRLPGTIKCGGTDGAPNPPWSGTEPGSHYIGRTQDIVVETFLFIPHATCPHVVRACCDQGNGNKAGG